jgi:ribosomal protein S12 methylthiotransferase
MGIDFTLLNLGCAKNQVDAEIMIACLEDRLDLRYVTDLEAAELIIVNTCGFIDPAKEESLETSLSLKARYPGRTVVLAGCLTQRYGGRLGRALKEMDGFLESRNPAEIVGLIANLLNRRLPEPTGTSTEHRGRRRRLLSFPGSAYITIASGCDNRCSYCAIPIIKGGLASRGRADVMEEIRQLSERGVVEFNLIAQDLASFGMDRGKGELVELLGEITGLDRNFWLRLLYIHPDHFPKEILSLMKADSRLLPYFDLPFQHASKDILKAMRREGDGDTYLRLIDTIRSALPEAVVRSTFLVGFPSEGDKDFRELEGFQKRAHLDWLGVFTYSREEGTPAHRMSGKVPRKVAEDRKNALQMAQIAITERRLDRFVGKELAVLSEEVVAGQNMTIGRGYLQAPEVDGLTVLRGGGDGEVGRFAPAKIVRRNGVDLEAIIEGTA